MINHSDSSTRRLHLLVSALLFLVIILGCGTTNRAEEMGKQLAKDSEQAKEQAQRLGDVSFLYRKTNQMDKLLGCYGEEFFEATSQEEWSQFLAGIDRKLGTLESYELQEWETRFQVAKESENAPPGQVTTIVLLRYHTKYSKHEADENLTLIRGENDQSFRIVGHHIESKAFLLE